MQSGNEILFVLYDGGLKRAHIRLQHYIETTNISPYFFLWKLAFRAFTSSIIIENPGISCKKKKSLAQEVRQKSDISEHRSKGWG